MYRTIILAATLLITASAFGQRGARYEHPQFEEIASQHKSIAIVPLNASIQLRPREDALTTDQEFENLREDFSYASQFDLESYFLNRKSRKGFRVRIQDIDETNKILSQNGIDHNTIIEYTGAELANILGVDAIVVGSIHTTRPNSEEVAVAADILFDIPLNTHANIIHLKLVDNTGEVLWKYQKRVGRGLGHDTFSTSIPLFRKAARRLPYGRV